MSKRDGGPAFPIVGTVEDVKVSVGMSLRDYFAAAALQGYLASWSPEGNNPATVANRVADTCYKLADAMLAERAKA